MQSARCVGGRVWVCVGWCVCETNHVSHGMYVGVCGRMWGDVCEPNHLPGWFTDRMWEYVGRMWVYVGVYV